MVPFAAVRGVETGVLGDIVAGDAGRVGGIAAACRVGVLLASPPWCSNSQYRPTLLTSIVC